MLTVFKAVLKDFQQTSLLRLKVSITSYLSSEMERTHGRHMRVTLKLLSSEAAGPTQRSLNCQNAVCSRTLLQRNEKFHKGNQAVRCSTAVVHGERQNQHTRKVPHNSLKLNFGWSSWSFSGFRGCFSYLLREEYICYV